MNSVFTDAELEYLGPGERRLARVATIGADGVPHVVPTGWTYNGDLDTVDLGGMDLTKTKKFRDVVRNPAVALVVDDVLPPWQPRGIEIRGLAEAIDDPEPLIRIRPRRVVSWGLDGDTRGGRDVGH
ncbi:MAG: PPOX class F420-dependent oxidoreductase [Streptosporangiales bacterium]|nr:PPOX class F420-dependent oxidoreductase [Streptosporangiales bacterium]MBO0892326.1 PPOX class F420-dependent oxidoreductase [Acidothermales bacterium]